MADVVDEPKGTSLCGACLRALARRKADATTERSHAALRTYADECGLQVVVAGPVAYALPPEVLH